MTLSSQVHEQQMGESSVEGWSLLLQGLVANEVLEQGLHLCSPAHPGRLALEAVPFPGSFAFQQFRHSKGTDPHAETRRAGCALSHSPKLGVPGGQRREMACLLTHWPCLRY